MICRRACRKYPNNKCLGTRELLAEEDEMQPNGRVFKKVILGKYIWLTYTQVAEKLKKFGSGLQAIGHQQRQNIVIFAETKAEWIIAAQACFTYNYPGEDCYLTPLIKLFYHCICTASCCVVNSNRHDFYLM